MKDDLPRKAWLVMKMGSLTAGVQYEPECKSPSYFLFEFSFVNCVAYSILQKILAMARLTGFSLTSKNWLDKLNLQIML